MNPFKDMVYCYSRRSYVCFFIFLFAFSAVAQSQFHCETNSGKLTIRWYEPFTNIRQSVSAPKELVVPSIIEGLPVVSIGDRAFAGQAMRSVVIPSGVTNIGSSAFDACRNLTNVVIPATVVEIGFGAFSGCHDLTRIAIPAGVKTIGDVAFSGSISLQSIEVDPLNAIYRSVDGILFDKAEAKLLCCPGGKGGNYAVPEGTKVIGDLAFNSCDRITSITMPASVERIEWHSFASCRQLTNVSIGSGVVDIGGDVPWLPFNGCQKLEITVDPANRVFSSKDGVLFDKKGNALLAFPGGRGANYSIPDGVIEIKAHAFDGSSDLASIHIPDSVTTIGDSAFENCSSLTNVVIGKNVRAIGDQAFARCQNIEMIVIPDNVESLGAATFASCSHLTNAVIVSERTKIGRGAFWGCNDAFKLTKKSGREAAGPQIVITHPTNNTVVDVPCMDIRGALVGQDVERVEIAGSGQVLMHGVTFEARNVFLKPGTNLISAIAYDRQGIRTSNTVVIVNSGRRQDVTNLPVRLNISSPAGFNPLPVTLSVDAHVPGEIQQVFYDLDGDGIADIVRKDLKPVTYTYKTNGQYFPSVTIQTSVGYFSSLSGGMAMFAAALGDSMVKAINIEAPPILVETIKVTDPVDIKWIAPGALYVLSGQTATLSEFDFRGKLLRSKAGLGSRPSSLDVDAAGNVYVTITGDNQVAKFKPTADSFEADSSFGSGGRIGSEDRTGGSNSGQFDGPFGVMVTDRDRGLMISDSRNHRIQIYSPEGKFLRSQSFYGTSRDASGTPGGLVIDENERYLFIIDPTVGRIALGDVMDTFIQLGSSGSKGSGLGEFNDPTHLCATERGLYVADSGNDRVQIFQEVRGGEMHSPVPFMPRVALSRELGLKHPQSVSAVSNLLEELIFIADTGNDRVILVQIPAETPEKVWNHLVSCLESGEVDGALADFSLSSRDKYAQAYKGSSKEELKSMAKDMKRIKPVYIRGEEAQYHFETVVNGTTLTFPVEFIKEFGRWKVSEF